MIRSGKQRDFWVLMSDTVSDMDMKDICRYILFTKLFTKKTLEFESKV